MARISRSCRERPRAARPVLLAMLCLAGPTAASAAQRPAGTVLAWGLNYSGELGNGSTPDSSTPVPVDLPAGTSVSAVAAGSDDTLALPEQTSSPDRHSRPGHR
jgi:alpha-tubulin suppressor-like RCC1 family protein